MNRKRKDNKQYYAFLEGWFSLTLNLILFAVKLWAGVVSQSIALIADAWHTLSDSVTSIVVLIGAKISIKPADEKHPFGHGRAESIASIVIGVLLAVVAFSFMQDSISQFKEKKSANFGTIAIVVTIISIVVKEIMAQLAIRYGKKVDSLPMIADGWHHRSDAISSAVILIGIILGKNYWWVDAGLGIVIGLLILATAIGVLKKAISPLLGEKVSDGLEKKIIEIAKIVTNEDLNIYRMQIHNYGGHKELTFHIKLPGNLKIEQVSIINKDLVRLIHSKLGIYTTINVDSI